jgi:hypothetical protein
MHQLIFIDNAWSWRGYVRLGIMQHPLIVKRSTGIARHTPTRKEVRLAAPRSRGSRIHNGNGPAFTRLQRDATGHTLRLLNLLRERLQALIDQQFGRAFDQPLPDTGDHPANV